MKANPNVIYLVHFLSAYQLKNHVGDRDNLKIVGDNHEQTGSFASHVPDRARKAKEAVGRQRHREPRNGRKIRECRNGIT
jgi:hypothetical protein